MYGKLESIRATHLFYTVVRKLKQTMTHDSRLGARSLFVFRLLGHRVLMWVDDLKGKNEDVFQTKGVSSLVPYLLQLIIIQQLVLWQ